MMVLRYLSSGSFLTGLESCLKYKLAFIFTLYFQLVSSYKVTSTGTKANIETHKDLFSMIGIDSDQIETLLPIGSENQTRVDNFVAKHPCVQMSSQQSNVQITEEPLCSKEDARTEQPKDGITCKQNNTNTSDELGDNTTKSNTNDHHVHDVCLMKEDAPNIYDSVKQDIDQNPNICEFNLRQYIQLKELPVGKSGFDKNLNICSGKIVFI